MSSPPSALLAFTLLPAPTSRAVAAPQGKRVA
jgi:hypothetical protein